MEHEVELWTANEFEGTKRYDLPGQTASVIIKTEQIEGPEILFKNSKNYFGKDEVHFHELVGKACNEIGKIDEQLE